MIEFVRTVALKELMKIQTNVLYAMNHVPLVLGQENKCVQVAKAQILSQYCQEAQDNVNAFQVLLPI